MNTLERIWSIITDKAYDKKKTQNDIAEHLNKSHGAISQMKNGAIKFTPDYLEKIISFLDIQDEADELRSLLWEHLTGIKPSGEICYIEDGKEKGFLECREPLTEYGVKCNLTNQAECPFKPGPLSSEMGTIFNSLRTMNRDQLKKVIGYVLELEECPDTQLEEGGSVRSA